MPPEDTDSTIPQSSTQSPLSPSPQSVGINPQETLPPPPQFPPADVPQNQPPNVPPETNSQSVQVETPEKPKKSLAAWCLAVFYLIYTFLLIFILISQVTSGSTSIISFIPQILISVFIFLSVIFYSKILMEISYIYIGFWLIVYSLLNVIYFLPQTNMILRRIFDNAFLSITFGFLGTILIDFITLAKLLHLTFPISFLTFYFIIAAISIISLVILRLSVLSFGKSEGIKKFIPEIIILFLIVAYGIITFLGNTFTPKLFSSAPKGLMLTIEAPSLPPDVAPAQVSQNTLLSNCVTTFGTSLFPDSLVLDGKSYARTTTHSEIQAKLARGSAYAIYGSGLHIIVLTIATSNAEIAAYYTLVNNEIDTPSNSQFLEPEKSQLYGTDVVFYKDKKQFGTSSEELHSFNQMIYSRIKNKMTVAFRISESATSQPDMLSTFQDWVGKVCK